MANSRFAPQSHRIFTTTKSPRPAAVCWGVSPMLSDALTSAPESHKCSLVLAISVGVGVNHSPSFPDPIASPAHRASLIGTVLNGAQQAIAVDKSLFPLGHSRLPKSYISTRSQTSWAPSPPIFKTNNVTSAISDDLPDLHGLGQLLRHPVADSSDLVGSLPHGAPVSAG